MKLLARFGAITVLALVAVSAFGVSQAAAAGETTLCKINQPTCTAPNQHAAGDFKSMATNTELFTGPGNIVCPKSTLTNKTAAVAGNPLLGQINELNHEPCTWKGTTCAVTAINLAWKSEISNGTTPDGIMKIVAAAGEPRLAFSCNGGIYKCVYGATEIVLDIHGGNPAETIFKKEVLGLKKQEGTVECPMNIEWSATYIATTPAAVFVSKN